MVLRGAPMTISVEDVRIFVSDSMAYVTCIEVMDAGDSRGRCVHMPAHALVYTQV